MTQNLQFESRVGQDGILTLRIPLTPSDANTDVIVTIQAKPPSTATVTQSEWPPEYFEQTYGSMAGDPLQIPEDPAPASDEGLT